jgi:hypothetical protein
VSNEADRVARERRQAADAARTAETGRAEEGIRAAQRRLMGEIEAEIPRALARLAAEGYPDSVLVNVPRPSRGFGPFASAKYKYVERAAWTIAHALMPDKESPHRARYLLISNGSVLAPYGVLSEKQIDDDWRSHKKYPHILGIDPWPGQYSPARLAVVLDGLRGLPYPACRHCPTPVVSRDGEWRHFTWGAPRDCRTANNDRFGIGKNDIDGSVLAEPTDE